MRRTTLGLAVAVACLGMGRGAPAQMIDPRVFDAPPGATAFRPDQISALAAMLDTESRQFVPAVMRELGGTRQGRQLVMRGNAMRATAEAFARTLQPGGDPSQQALRLDQFAQALDAVQAELNNPPGTAPVAAAISQRLGRLAFEIRRATGGGFNPVPLPGVIPGPPLVDTVRVMRLAQSASANLNSVNGFLAADVGQLPPFDGVMYDIQALDLGMQQISRLGLSGGASLPTFQAVYQPLRARASQVNSFLQTGNPALRRAQTAWASAAVSLNGLSQALGFPADLVTAPIPPLIPQPPLIPNPGFGVPAVISLADQLAGEIDGFIAAVRPNALVIPQGMQFVADARALRGDAIAFRQRVAAGANPAQVRSSFQQLDRSYARLLNRINRVSGFRSGPNIDRIRRLGGLVDQIRALVAL